MDLHLRSSSLMEQWNHTRVADAKKISTVRQTKSEIARDSRYRRQRRCPHQAAVATASAQARANKVRGTGHRRRQGSDRGRTVMKASEFFDPFEFVQRGFVPPPAWRDVARKNAADFWTNQEKILDSMRTFADGWIERRRAGTEAALGAAQHMCEAETQLDAVREYQKWAAGSFERLVRDGLEYQKQMMALGQLMIRPLATDESGAGDTRQKSIARPRAA
jgi:hypothetical protein